MSQDTTNLPYVTAVTAVPRPFVALMLWSEKEGTYKHAKILAFHLHDAAGAVRVAKKMAKKLGFEYR